MSAENLTVKIAVHQPEGLQYTTAHEVGLNHLSLVYTKS